MILFYLLQQNTSSTLFRCSLNLLITIFSASAFPAPVKKSVFLSRNPKKTSSSCKEKFSNAVTCHFQQSRTKYQIIVYHEYCDWAYNIQQKTSTVQSRFKGTCVIHCSIALSPGKESPSIYLIWAPR